jgi:hypothetical protein
MELSQSLHPEVVFVNVLGTARLFALVLTISSPSLKQTAPALIGHWQVGAPYETNQSAGLNNTQENYIESLHLEYDRNRLRVCGKDVPIQSIKAEALTEEDFLDRYHFHPTLIGVGESNILELSITAPDATPFCGEYGEPGLHVFVGDNKHAVIEVANDYFPLIRH